MALPSDVTTVRVYGTYVDFQGNAIPNATVTFTANARLRSAATHTAVLPNTYTAKPDGTGYLEIQLPCTDNSAITPTGWSWAVTEKFGDYVRQYTMLAPSGAAIDLTNVQPASVLGPPPVTQVVSVAGRKPNAQGDVPVAFPVMPLKGFEPFPRQLSTMGAKVIRGDTALVMGVCQTAATVTTLRAATWNTAATAPTLVRMGIYSLSGGSTSGSIATLAARTASSTSMFTAAWASYSAALDSTGGYPTSFTFVPGQTYALALLVVGGTTDPLYYGVFGWLGGAATLDPLLTNNFAAQPDLATSYTIGSNSAADMPWIGAT